MMKIETERLVLREMTRGDFGVLYEIFSDPETMQHYPKPFDRDRVMGWIDWSIDNYSRYGFGLWAVTLKDTGRVIGDCGLSLQIIDGEQLPEIGYHIHKSLQRQGYGKEAARAARDWAFENTAYDALYSYMKYTNVGSYSTALANGMTKIKEYPDEKNKISCAYRITRSEWENLKRCMNGAPPAGGKSILESTLNTRPLLGDSLRFIRSDAPTALTERDRKWLLDNGVTTVVDLRDDRERAERPCPLEKDGTFTYLAMPVTGGGTIPRSPAEVMESYKAMCDGQAERIVGTIMNATSKVLYFCHAGKDRTGVISALILRRLGFPESYIVGDYLLSGENLRDMLRSFAENVPGVDLNVITPRAEYIESVLELLKERGR